VSHVASLSGKSVVASEDELDARFLYRAMVFLEPERTVHPISWLDYAPFAFWIVDALRPSVFVELGCHSGNSYASFAQAVQTLGLPAACYGVDTWRGDPHAGFFEETVFEEWSAYHDRRFSTFSRLIRATFDEAREHFADGSIDLLHLDGYHTFEAATHDFESWRPKLSARGVILCHDINVREGDFGAWRMWERLREDYPSFEFLHGHGLGVLGMGPDLPPAVEWLLSLRARDSESVSRVRMFFSRLGAAVLARVAAEESKLALRTELASRESQLTAVNADVATLNAALAESRQRLGEATADGARLDAALADANARLAEASVASEQRAREVVEATGQLSQATADADRLNRDLSESKEQLAEANQRMAVTRTDGDRLGKRLKTVERALAKQTAHVRSLRASLETSNEELARRARQIEESASEIGALHDRVRVLATDLDVRGAHIARLERDLEQVPSALRARDDRISALDAEAVEALDELRRETAQRYEETKRRTSLETVLTWSQAQLSALANGDRLSKQDVTARAPNRPARGPHASLPRKYRNRMSTRQLRDFEVLAVSRLFDSTYYLAGNPDAAAANASPLAHYVLVGAAQRRDPHPLFSTTYYAAQVSDLRASANALEHYLTRGWRLGYSPHPLFNPAHYLAQDRDAARRGGDPLQHYLEQGVAARRSPHPLFDVAFYLRENPDVASAGIDPLTHFLQKGARDGRRPNPSFDVDQYVREHPDVQASGENPLVHYLRHGGLEQQAQAAYDRDRRLERAGASRIQLTMRSLGRRETRRPTIVVVSHVGPWRPKAGNEYRVCRMLRWYRRNGYRVIPVIAPLPGEELPREGVEEIAAEFGDAVQCHRDGRVEYILRHAPHALTPLDGSFTRAVADLIGEEHAAADPRQRQLLQMERTFCHDVVASTVLQLERTLGPYVLQVEYIWMTRLLPLVRGNVLKVVDTIDVFSSIPEKVSAFGLNDVVIEPDEEANRLRRADLVVAIQDEEGMALKRLAPSVPVITAGVDFDVVGDVGAADRRRILYIASNNPRNRKGLDDFLRLAWPRIHRLLPDAELLVAGSVSESVATSELPGVTAIGPVEDVTALYREAALVINPAVAGTGIKIKTLEALCHARPVVTWPNGVEGLDPSLAAYCLVARDWYEFSERAVGALSASGANLIGPEARHVIARHVSAEHVYASLDAALRAFFEQACASTADRYVSAKARTVAHAID